MIKGATQLIAGIPGRYLDPFHLAESQPADFCGYSVIAYNTDRRVWDLLVLRGRAITESARIDGEERKAMEPKEVEERFNTAGLRDRSRIYLFEASAPLLDPFVRTLGRTPVLKVQVDPLSRSQLIRLIKSVPGDRFVAERFVLQPGLPMLEFLEIKSPEQQIHFELRFRKGFLMLYRTGSGEEEAGAQLHLGLDDKNKAETEHTRGKIPALAEFARKFGVEAAACLKKKGEGLLPLGPSAVLFEQIPIVVKAAGAFKRSRLRRAALEMTGELYSEKYEELKKEDLLAKVEECYRQLKA